MAGNKEASVILKLKIGDFVGSLRQVSNEIANAGKKAASSIAPGTKSLQSMRKASMDLGRSLVGTISNAAKFGGVFAIGGAVKHAQDMQGKYGDLAFTIGRVTGKAMKWQDVQKQIEPVAIATTRSSDELADAMKRIFAETGDAKYSAAALFAVGKAATASGKPVEELADLAGVLQKKYGATAATLPGMIATALEKTSGGGASLEQVVGSFGKLAQEARAAGLTGKEGLATTLGMISALKNQGMEEETAARGMRMLFQQTKNGTSQMVALNKAGAKFAPDSGPLEKLRGILAMGSKGQGLLDKVFGKGEVRNVVDNLTKPFDAAYKKAKDAGATSKDAQLAGMKAFDASLKDLSKTTYSEAQMLKDATAREGSAKRNMALALETFTQEFNKPEVTASFKELAAVAPKVAKALSQLARFAIEHPYMAAGGYAAAKIGGAGLLGSAGASSAGELVAVGIKSGVKGLGGMIGKEIAASGLGATLGKACGVAAGAAVAAYLAKQYIDSELEKDKDTVGSAKSALAEAQDAAENPNASPARKKEALDRLKEEQAKLQAYKPGALMSGIGVAASIVSGGEVKGPEEERANTLARMEAAAKVIEQALTRGAANLEQGSQRAAQTIGNAKPGGAVGGPGSNGLPPRPSNAPGHGGL